MSEAKRTKKELEDELLDQRNLLNAIFECSQFYLVFLDRDFKVVQVNQPIARGADPLTGSWVGRNMSEIFPDDQQRPLYEKARDTGEIIDIEDIPFSLPGDPPGVVSYFDMRITPFPDRSGETSGLALSILDVTERVKSRMEREQQIKTSNLLLEISRRALSETTINGVLDQITQATLELMHAKVGFAGLVEGEEKVHITNFALKPQFSFFPPDQPVLGEMHGPFNLLLQSSSTVWITRSEMEKHPLQSQIPAGHPVLSGLLGARLVDRDGKLTGLLMASQKEAGDFSQQDEELIEQVANIASLRMQQITARTEAERRTLETERIFASLAEAVTVCDINGRITHANPAAIKIFGEDVFSEEIVDIARRLAVRDLQGRLLTTGRLILHRALRGETIDDEKLLYTDQQGEDHLIRVSSGPIKTGDELLGAAMVWHDITREKKIERRIRRGNRDLQLINRLQMDVTATLDFSQVYDRILNAVQVLIKPEGVSIWVWDDKVPGNLVCVAAHSPVFKTTPLQMSIPSEGNLAGWVALNGVSALTVDPLTDVRFSREIAAQMGWRVDSVLVAPLPGRERTLGSLHVVNKSSGKFGVYDRILLETLAAAAGTAIENAQLHLQAQEAAALAERYRLARDLHDAVSQSLFSASVIAEALPRLLESKPDKARTGLEQLQLLTRGALAELRSLLLEIHPTALTEANLDTLLQQLAAAAANRSSTQIEVDSDERLHLPEAVQIAFFRIAQEALNNIIKHARADHTCIRLQRLSSGTIELQVTDDGRGFDPGQEGADGMGLDFMRQRASLAGIELEIDSQPGTGTQITARWQEGGVR